jgi:hypothetical protein
MVSRSQARINAEGLTSTLYAKEFTMKCVDRNLWADLLAYMMASLEPLIKTFELADMADEWAAASEELEAMGKDMASIRKYHEYKAVVKEYPFTHKWMDIENRRQATMFNI